MKRMIAVVVLLACAAGCGEAKQHRVNKFVYQQGPFAPGPYPTEDQAYLEGFMEGYRGVRPLESCGKDRSASARGGAHNQGTRDGYAVGRRDEMQRR